MDVGNLNGSELGKKNKLKKPVCNAQISQFSIETYFIWFSALIFVTELIVDVWVAILYFNRDKIQWGLITLSIIILPLVLCQIYSLWLLRTDSTIRVTALSLHVLLLGIPYRYHNILRKVEKDKTGNQEWELIKQRIRDANAIQIVNAIFQYFPQCLFQSFLIVNQKYKCVITGVSAGLAGFSFIWHVFIYFYYLVKRYNTNDDMFDLRSTTSTNNPRIIDNLSTTITEMCNRNGSGGVGGGDNRGGGGGGGNCSGGSGPSSIISNNISQASVSLTDSLRNFEKPMYKTDDKNLMSKKQTHAKNVEKNKIFGFNKRKPIYEREDFDLYESNNMSTVFFEIDDSGVSEISGFGATGGGGGGGNVSGTGSHGIGRSNGRKFDLTSSSNKDLDNFINENHSNHLSKNISDFKYKFGNTNNNGCSSDYDDEILNEKKKFKKQQLAGSTILTTGSGAAGGAVSTGIGKSISGGTITMSSSSSSGNGGGGGEQRNSLLKRKGICSSQEMLHLVDIMNDHISPEQVDVLAKSLVELGGEASLQTESEHDDPDNLKLLEQFPKVISDDRLLENIDAAIYENQIIFQERIRKNQLTIQNLKLQDQLLSKCIEDMKTIMPGTEVLSIRDYENMCFTNINRQNRGMKHWRNYLQDIDTSNHDSSTVQHSSYYVNTNTMSNSLTDLYINETEENASTVMLTNDDDDDDDDDDDNDVNDNVVNVQNKRPNVKESTTGKNVRWHNKLTMNCGSGRSGAGVNNSGNVRNGAIASGRREEMHFCCDETIASDDLYINMDEGRISVETNDQIDDDDDSPGALLPEKNILVETINKINVDSPIKNLLTNNSNFVNLKNQ